MKSIKIFTITLLLASLAVGCQDKNDGHIRIFAESIGGHNGKVAFNPGNIPSGAEWIAGETVKLNGTLYNITEESGQGFYLTDNNNDGVQPLASAMHAVYPGSNFGGNDVVVTNSEIVLNRLVIEKVSDNQQKIAFPMAAEAEADATKLYFKHLTGGFRITMNNKTANDLNVASLKVVARSTTTVTNLGVDGVTARWAVQGPSVPTGEVGENEENVDVKYSSVMYFDFKNGSNNYVNLSASTGSYMFCVPITISSVRYLTITGYATDGTELFNKTHDLGEEVEVVRNTMYTITDININ